MNAANKKKSVLSFWNKLQANATSQGTMGVRLRNSKCQQQTWLPLAMFSLNTQLDLVIRYMLLK